MKSIFFLTAVLYFSKLQVKLVILIRLVNKMSITQYWSLFLN